MPPIKLQLKVIEQDRVMRIRLKNLNTESMQITQEGIELEFREADDKHVGDLIIAPTKITWNKGKKSKTGKSRQLARVFQDDAKAVKPWFRRF